MTEENKRALQAAESCHIYDILHDLKDVKVRCHCYITGKCRG